MGIERLCPTCSKRFSAGHEVCPDDGSPLVNVPEADLIGKTVDRRYLILDVIGRGGMGVVYRARHQILQREVALKTVRREVVQDETAVKRFLTEARSIAALTNPHTVTIHDSGVTEDGTLYYTMELLTGQPLSHLLRRHGRLPYRRAADLMAQVCESLAEAHAKGIVHRDIKPDNIFVTRAEGKDLVKLVDFGIAKVLDETGEGPVTRTGMLCGTPRYLSPEQVSGEKAGPAADLYALGVVLYELLTGSPPFSGETPAQVMMMHLQEAAPTILARHPDAGIPVALDRFIAMALQKSPAARFQSAMEFRRALLAACEDVSTDTATRTDAALPELPSGLAETLPGIDTTAPPHVFPVDLGQVDTLDSPAAGTADWIARTETASIEQLGAPKRPASKARSETDPMTFGKEPGGSVVPARSGRGRVGLLLGGLLVGVVAALGLLWALDLLPGGERSVDPGPAVERPTVEASPAGLPSASAHRRADVADGVSALPAAEETDASGLADVQPLPSDLSPSPTLLDLPAQSADVGAVEPGSEMAPAAPAADVTGAGDARPGGPSSGGEDVAVSPPELVPHRPKRVKPSPRQPPKPEQKPEPRPEEKPTPKGDDWFDDVEKLPVGVRQGDPQRAGS